MQKYVDVDDLIIGDNVRIDAGVKISGGKIIIDDNTTIKRGTVINVADEFFIGKGSIIGENNIIRGRKIELGREFYSNHNGEIGGGSCFEATSELIVGYWFHLGSYSMVNTAMGVKIGNTVGLGRFSNIYTHGAYLSSLEGYPVSFGPINIGNDVWIPRATINPNVTIGSNVVIALDSVVNKDVPSNSFAGGTPCKVLRKDAYPKILSLKEKTDLINNINLTFKLGIEQKSMGHFIVDKASIDIDEMKIHGEVSEKSERARNVLRRHGIRFKYEVSDGIYRRW